MPKRDPAITAHFKVAFGSKLKGAFRECTIISAETEPAEYKFTGADGKPGYYAIPGRLKWGRITLKRGITDDKQCWTWRKEVEDGNVETARTPGSIFMLDQKGTLMAQFDFENAWPLKVSGPAPNANSSDLAIEEIEIIAEKVIRSA